MLELIILAIGICWVVFQFPSQLKQSINAWHSLSKCKSVQDLIEWAKDDE